MRDLSNVLHERYTNRIFLRKNKHTENDVLFAVQIKNKIQCSTETGLSIRESNVEEDVHVPNFCSLRSLSRQYE